METCLQAKKLKKHQVMILLAKNPWENMDTFLEAKKL